MSARPAHAATISAVPAATARTVPSESTVATPPFRLVHEIDAVGQGAAGPRMLAVNWTVAPIPLRVSTAGDTTSCGTAISLAPMAQPAPSAPRAPRIKENMSKIPRVATGSELCLPTA